MIEPPPFLKRFSSRSGTMSNEPFVMRIASTAVLGLTAVWLFSRFASITASQVQSYTGLSTQDRRKRKTRLDTWIREQQLYALTSIVAAFGPDGKNAPGTSSGCMIASPSRPGSYLDQANENENYFFQWTRDGSLCLRVVLRKLREAELGEVIGMNEEDPKCLDTLIKQFVSMNRKLQFTENQSGGPFTGGLGEPKFEVSGAPFEGCWGRPQNDGPAIRASTLIRYARHLLENHTDQKAQAEARRFIESNLYSKDNSHSFIFMDINHICGTWRLPTFDLWEEVKATNGGHFYTLMVQRRALQDMIDLINFQPEFQPSDANVLQKYYSIISEMDARLEDFWNPSGLDRREGGPGCNPEAEQAKKPDGSFGVSGAGDNKIIADCVGLISDCVLKKPHILPTLDRLHGQPKPFQTDTAVLLAINHTAEFDSESIWAPWSERSLATLDRLVDIFSAIYKINNNKGKKDGIAIGRYPEDNYDGKGSSIGHPWFLCTNSVAETLYLTAQHFKQTGTITITPTNVSLFRRLIPEIDLPGSEPFKVQRGSETFTRLVVGIREWADSFIEDVSMRWAGGGLHGPRGGCGSQGSRMSEQIHRESGHMRGARELTWSYASFLTAIDARDGKAPN
ncbi:hypothetical protein CROQUDRAFT_654270 [Cronartium quercuum f. sp. fusiforme G11]|uniref:GH15-like domain-containing protein n=1 Tax=Cronartium quercuum f. sp. fusiforme G11 TaxID=708437 RepID=A0A9P6TDY1_9BASI|nr:hypothetical protein CROQUDRAFT_654270 [Cronartium quercuum f. sp. fusiforme G11]